MADKRVIIKEGVEHSGIFKFSDFYEFAFRWLKEEDFGVIEEKYKEKVNGNARGIVVEWRADKPISDYFKFEMPIKMEIQGLVDVEVEIDDKKKKMNKGAIKVELKGVMIQDPESKWSSSPIYQFMRDRYNKYVINKRIDEQETKLKDYLRDFKEELKAFLELQGRRK